jgi:hypothetical protein
VGTNDHIPSKSTRTPRKSRHTPVEMLAWMAPQVTEMQPLITAISVAGGYVGMGRSAKGDCLLIYVKLDDWVERIPVENPEDLQSIVADLLADL